MFIAEESKVDQKVCWDGVLAQTSHRGVSLYTVSVRYFSPRDSGPELEAWRVHSRVDTTCASIKIRSWDLVMNIAKSTTMMVFLAFRYIVIGKKQIYMYIKSNESR